MIDSTVPLVERALWFAPGTFTDMARTRDMATCRHEAGKARRSARTSLYPLQCHARAAWWDSLAARCEQQAQRAAG